MPMPCGLVTNLKINLKTEAAEILACGPNDTDDACCRNLSGWEFCLLEEGGGGKPNLG